MSKPKRPAQQASDHRQIGLAIPGVQKSDPIARYAKLAERARTSLSDVIEFYEERAAIREYVGGLSRDQAELNAWDDTMSHFEGRVRK